MALSKAKITLLLILTHNFIFLSCSSNNNKEKDRECNNDTINISWDNEITGDFSFTNKWDHPETLSDAAPIDTSRNYHTIESETNSYEWFNTDYAETERIKGDTVICNTLMNAATHSSLTIKIAGDLCIPHIKLISIAANNDIIFKGKCGYIHIDENLWSQNILKAEFSFKFTNPLNPDSTIWWKGKIYSPIKTKSYDELKSETKNKREEFYKAYIKAQKQQKDSIVVGAQSYIIDRCDDFFRAWYGTPWTFEGHTSTPRKGSIACGYFITTTLQDLGFKIPRYYWAQQTADYMTYKLSKDVTRFYKTPMKEIVSHIEAKGEGLYIAGLDCHVGYIYYHQGKMNFVHSNYYKKSTGVMSEQLIGRNPLNDSKLKVIGKIMDKEMIINWILNTQYEK